MRSASKVLGLQEDFASYASPNVVLSNDLDCASMTLEGSDKLCGSAGTVRAEMILQCLLRDQAPMLLIIDEDWEGHTASIDVIGRLRWKNNHDVLSF